MKIFIVSTICTFISLFLFCNCYAIEPDNISLEEYFEKAFGKKYEKKASVLEVQLYIEDEYFDDVYFNFQPNFAESSIASELLLQELEKILLPEIHASLKSKEKNNKLFIGDLQQQALKVIYDEYSLDLKITIPLEKQRIRLVGLRDYYKRKRHRDQPQPLSNYNGYININAFDSYHNKIATAPGGNFHRRTPLTANFNMSFNIKDYILEADANFKERDKKTNWRHGDLRVIHDIPDKGWRVTMGDLNYTTVDNQQFQKLAGVTVANNFRNKGINFTSPSGRKSFVLEKKSTVEVFINEQKTKTIKLNPGKYDLREFSFQEGANDVTLKFTAEDGRIEYIEFPFYYSNELLDKGLHDYSYSLGIPVSNSDNHRHYNVDEPVVSMFHRWGFLDNITLGGNLQLNKLQGMFGTEFLTVNRLGFIDAELAASHIMGGGSGLAWQLQYSVPILSSSLSLNVSGRSKKFATFGNLDPNNKERYNLSLRATFPFLFNTLGTFSSAHVFRNGWHELNSVQNLSFSKRFNHGLSLSFRMSRIRKLSENPDYNIYAALSWSLPNSQHSLSLDHDVEAQASSLDWSYSPVSNINSFGGGVKLEKHPKQRQTESNLTYSGYNFISELHNYTTTNKGGYTNADTMLTSAKYASAIAFADGNIGLSRPINNSFVMVKPIKELKGYKIDVEPIAEGLYSSHTGGLGNIAVVPDLGEYQERTVSIDYSDLPPGTDVEDTTFKVKSKYKSATVIEIGTDATIELRGVAIDALGKGLDQIALEVKRLGDADKIAELPIYSFTNNRGNFFISGIRPGNYVITAFLEDEPKVELNIPEDIVGVYRLGKVEFK